jgi:hypothetical protein
MPSFSKRLWRWLKSPSHVYPLALLLVYVWFGIIYFSHYVPQHRRNINEQAFRSLQVGADRIASNIEDLTSIVQAQVLRNGLPDPKVQQLPDQLQFSKCEPQVLDNIQSNVLTLRPWSKSGKIVLRWVYKFESSSGTGQKPTLHDPDALCAEAQFEENVASIIKPLLSARFDQVALALNDGRIVFSQGKTGVGIADLNRFLTEQKPTLSELAAQLGRQEKSTRSSDSDPVTRLSAMVDVAASSWSKDLRASTSSLDWLVRDQHYLLLMQPVASPVPSVTEQGQLDPQFRLTLMGMMDAGLLSREANYLSVGVWANFFIVVLCALILSGTLLKFFYAGPGEAIRNTDLLLFFCGMCCVSALGSMLFFLDLNRMDYREVDARSKDLAEAVERHFRNEVVSVIDLLDVIPRTKAYVEDANAVKSWQLIQPEDRLVVRTQALTGKSRCTAFNKDKLTSSPCQESPAAAEQLSRILYSKYPWLDQVFWTAPDGWQALKWTVKYQITGRVDASKYEWYKKLRRGQTWTVESEARALKEFAFDTLYSPNTGEYFAIILTVPSDGSSPTAPTTQASKSERQRRESDNLRLPVIAAVTPMISLAQPVVPSGYGFALIDSDGLVRFHSDPSRNLRENFLSELGSRRQLPSSTSVEPNIFEDTYHGVATRFRVQQLSSFGPESYTLIVYRNLEHRDRLYQGALKISIKYGLIYGFLVLFAIKISVWCGEKLWARGHKPPIQDSDLVVEQEQAHDIECRNFGSSILNLKSTNSFVVIVLVLVALATFVWIRLVTSSADNLDVLSLVIILAGAISIFPLLAALILFGETEAVGNKGGPTRRPERWNFITVFTLAVTLAVYVFGCMPVALISKSAFRKAGQSNRQLALTELANQLETRADLSRAYYAKVPADPSAVSRVSLTSSIPLLYERLHKHDDLYIDKWTSYSDSLDESGCVYDQPASNETNVAAPFHICQIGDRLILFFHSGHKSEGNTVAESWRTPVRLEVDLPVMPFGIGWVLLSSAIFPILLTLVFSFVVFLVLRIVPKEAVGGSTKRLKTLDPKEIEPPGQSKKNWFFIVPPRFDVSSLKWPTDGVQVIDVDQPNIEWFQPTTSTRVVALASFERGLAGDQTARTLELLNKLLANSTCKILVMSCVEPITYLFESLLHGRHPAETDLRHCERWVNAVIAFELMATEELRDSVNKGDKEDTYFLWSYCTNREKLALWQIVQFGMANRANQQAVDQLSTRFLTNYNKQTGRIAAPPALDQLILRSESIRKEVTLLLESRVDTSWQGLKGSIVVTAIAGGAFFAITQTALSSWSEVFVAIASLGGAAAALQTVRQLISAISIRGSGPSA